MLAHSSATEELQFCFLSGCCYKKVALGFVVEVKGEQYEMSGHEISHHSASEEHVEFCCGKLFGWGGGGGCKC